MPTLEFKGKQFVYAHHLTVPFRQLNVVDKKSAPAKGAKPSLEDNLIIHGDNLHALKALLPQYAGRIKCIYIDPPYNTGNEGWCYNDKVNSPLMKEWLKKSANPVDKEDLERHDKWLSMMWPRLQLLRELLADDGVIFISIDDIEVHRLRAIMDELFGENSYVGAFIWRKKEGGGQTDDYFVTEHENILVFAKTHAFKWLDEVVENGVLSFNKEDADGKYKAVKLAKWGNAAKREDRPKQYFSIIAPDGSKVFPKAPDGTDGRWRVGARRMEITVENNLVHWERKNDEWIPYEKIYYTEGEVKVIKERSIIFDLVNTGDATKVLTQLFGKKDVFQNPKPYELVRFLLTYATDKDSIILDSFAGSGTTAHAVLALNKEDGGNRKFI
ncbi:MAG: site-specific DNA-methyltransferase, partial [Alphaproteobacteria bacterium]